ncbi:MAG: AlpA family phage regulatory protein [Caulobacteraceae bacterium]|nr:AlpA family phage regulatory protein [Caulobacteraceae bacterium]
MLPPPPLLSQQRRPRMLDRKQIAEKLGIKQETFRKRVEIRPDFPKPVLRLSRETVRWDEADIEQWLKRQRALAKA